MESRQDDSHTVLNHWSSGRFSGFDFCLMPEEKTQHIVLDATDRSLGRIASEAARYLQGKHLATWAPNADCGAVVVIQHLAHARFTGNKMITKQYYQHTNYPGNMKITTLQDRWKKDPRKLCALIIARMLPKNKLRARMLKRLRFED